MLILKWFHKVSGLGINKEKTKVIKVGAMRDGSIPLDGKYAFDRTSSYEILGIVYNINDMGNITDLNIKKKIGDIKTLSNIWQTCNLTPYRKTVVVKSLLLSKLTHLLLSLPSPDRHSITYPDSIVTQFLLAGKPAKIRREILEADSENKFQYFSSPQYTGVKIDSNMFSLPINGSETKFKYIFSPQQTGVKINSNIFSPPNKRE